MVEAQISNTISPICNNAHLWQRKGNRQWLEQLSPADALWRHAESAPASDPQEGQSVRSSLEAGWRLFRAALDPLRRSIPVMKHRNNCIICIYEL